MVPRVRSATTSKTGNRKGCQHWCCSTRCITADDVELELQGLVGSEVSVSETTVPAGIHLRRWLGSSQITGSCRLFGCQATPEHRALVILANWCSSRKPGKLLHFCGF